MYRSAMATAPVTARAALLQVLAIDREGHGYGLKLRVLGLTRGELELGDGSIYRALDGLVEEGLARSLDPTGGGTPSRRRYRITKQGRGAAARHRTAVLGLFGGTSGRTSNSPVYRERAPRRVRERS